MPRSWSSSSGRLCLARGHSWRFCCTAPASSCACHTAAPSTRTTTGETTRRRSAWRWCPPTRQSCQVRAPLFARACCCGLAADAPLLCADADKLLLKLIAKSSAQASFLVRETPALYAAAHEPRIAAIPASNVAWVHNILALEKETDRLLLNVPGDDGFLVNTDPKWASHPQTDPSKGPVDRASWSHHACVKDLYCLGLLHRRDVRSIRDLRGEHLPMLRALRAGALGAIHTTYGLPEHSIRAFFHYPPQVRAPRVREHHRHIAPSDPVAPSPPAPVLPPARALHGAERGCWRLQRGAGTPAG